MTWRGLAKNIVLHMKVRLEVPIDYLQFTNHGWWTGPEPSSDLQLSV